MSIINHKNRHTDAIITVNEAVTQTHCFQLNYFSDSWLNNKFVVLPCTTDPDNEPYRQSLRAKKTNNLEGNMKHNPFNKLRLQYSKKIMSRQQLTALKHHHSGAERK